jgi:(S)-ureidoglycine aminohydrolase
MKAILLTLTLLASSQLQAQLPSGIYSYAKAKKEKKDSGHRKPLIVGQSVDFDPYSVHYTTVKPGMASHAAHQHPTEELIIVKEGTVQLTINNQPHTLTKGDVALLAPNSLHGLQNIGSKPATYMVMLFKNKNPEYQHPSFTSKVIHWDSTQYNTHALGGRRNFFDGPTGQCKRFEMHVTTLNPGNKSHEPHTHRAAEILIVVEGKTEEYIADGWRKSDIGDIIYLESKVPHALRNIGKKPCTYFAFQFE